MNEAEFRARLKVFEGYAEHMYLDTAGEVTIGVGLMLPSAEAAQSASLGFHEPRSRAPADSNAIRQDFERVSDASAGMYPPDKYRPYTELVASTKPLDQALDRRLETAEADAIAFYPQYPELPSPVQYALLDMAFNLGRAGLLQYTRLKAALQNRQWGRAAEESHRRGIQDARNDAIAAWIAQGAVSH